MSRELTSKRSVSDQVSTFVLPSSLVNLAPGGAVSATSTTDPLSVQFCGNRARHSFPCCRADG